MFPKRKHCTYGSLIRNILLTTVLLPFFILVVKQFYGDHLGFAFKSAFYPFTVFPEAIYTYVALLATNALVVIFTHPVLAYWKKTVHGHSVSENLKNKAMQRLNKLPVFLIALCILTFASSLIGEAMEIFHLSEDTRKWLFFSFLDNIATGFFTGVLIGMNLELILFPVKQSLMKDPPAVKPVYRSFYRILMKSIIALLLFFSFQMISISSDFMEVGAEIRDLWQSGQGHDGPAIFMLPSEDVIRGALGVFSFRMFFFLCLGGQVLLLLKRSLKTPLQTVRERLVGLNSGDKEASKQIAIVNNDEFSEIYREINTLIEKQEGQIEQSRDHLARIIEHAADPIISFHADGTLLMLNPAAKKYFEIRRDQPDQCMLSSIFEEECCEWRKDSQQSLVEAFIADQREIKRYKGKTKDGDLRIFEGNISRSDSEDGPVYTAILRDVSRQVEVEKTLTRAKNTAERANRMKSEFLANMSHELRTPLNAVLGYTQLIEEDKNLTDGQRGKIKTIARSGEHLLGLINDILDISKIEAGKIEIHPAAFAFTPFIEDIREMFELRCRSKGIMLDVEYLNDLPEAVEGDIGKLRQIMINLLGNAVKFTSEGGISLVVGREENSIRFSITDTGKGIPEEDQSRILEPFTQSANTDNEGGTGLGLAITSRYIEMMGGTLEVRSTLGEGSTFTFALSLPETEQVEEKEEVRGTLLGIAGDRHPKALIVDDKTDNRLILKEMLETAGFVTMEAENGKASLERQEEFQSELVFMDIKMPVMDGYEAVGRLKVQYPDLPVFALTASAFKHDENKIRDAGFDGFLAKPFKKSRLFALIEENSPIDFLYDESSEQMESISSESIHWKAVVEALAVEEVDALDEAMAINDFLTVKEIAEGLRKREGMGIFAGNLIAMADNFNEDGLLELIEEARKQRGGE